MCIYCIFRIQIYFSIHIDAKVIFRQNTTIIGTSHKKNRYYYE